MTQRREIVCNISALRVMAMLLILLVTAPCHSLDRIYPQGLTVSAGDLAIDTLPASMYHMKVHVRAAGDSWSLVLGDSMGLTYRFTLSAGLPGLDDADDPGRMLTISRIYDLGDEIVASQRCRHCDGDSKGYNSLVLTYFRGTLNIYGGDKTLDGPFQITYTPQGQVTCHLVNGKPLQVQRIMTDSQAPPSAVYYHGDIDSLASRLAGSRHPVEGLWQYFDSNTDPSLARCSGAYTLAVVKDTDNPTRFNVYYLDGARQNGDQWRPGRYKGSLTPRGFEGVYTLRWVDADGYDVNGEGAAVLADNLLTLSFPLLKSTMRFSRLNCTSK